MLIDNTLKLQLRKVLSIGFRSMCIVQYGRSFVKWENQNYAYILPERKKTLQTVWEILGKWESYYSNIEQ